MWLSARVINKTHKHKAVSILQCLEKYSNTSYTAAAFTLVPGHPGLEINILPCRTISRTVWCTGAQSCMEDARVWQCMPDTGTNLRDWTCGHVCVSESFWLEGLSVEGLLSKHLKLWVTWPSSVPICFITKNKQHSGYFWINGQRLLSWCRTLTLCIVPDAEDYQHLRSLPLGQDSIESQVSRA